MTKRMVKGALLGVAIVAGTTGCEALVPFVISEATKDDGSDIGVFDAPLSVQIESARGTVQGREIAPEMLSPGGNRFGDQLQFLFRADTLSMHLTVNSAESSSLNPYTEFGRSPEDVGHFPRPAPIDAGLAGVPAASNAIFLACDDARGECLQARETSLEIVQTVDGRQGVLDCTLTDGSPVAIRFHYTEER